MSGRWRDRRVGCEKALVPEEGGGATMVKTSGVPSRPVLASGPRSATPSRKRMLLGNSVAVSP